MQSRKWMCLVLVLVMLLTMVACSKSDDKTNEVTNAPPVADSSGDSTTAQEDVKPTDAELQNAVSGAQHLSAFTRNGKVVVNAACTQNITSLDTMQGQSGGQTMCMWDMIYERLLTCDENGDPIGQLATKWETNDDYTEWTFWLREGVYFHNGELFDAYDVEATMNRAIAGQGTYSQVTGLWSVMDHVEVIDNYTVKIFFSSTYATPYDSWCLTMPILEDKALSELGDSYFFDGYCYGTGKWKFKEFVDGAYISVTRNDNYWGGNTSNVDEFSLYFITEGSAIVTGMLSGEIDACNRLGADLMSMYDGYNEISLGKVSTNSIVFVGLQCGEGHPFNDVNVRKAFSYAIDRQLIADAIMGGGNGIASWIPVGAYGYSDEFEPIYDPAQAKELLENSSYKGEEIIIYVNTAVTNGEAMMLTVADMANAIGFNIKLQMVEQAFVTDVRSTGEYDAYVVTCSWNSKDVGPTYKSRFGNPGHHHNYDNQELYDLIEEIQTASGTEKRTEILYNIQKIMFDEVAPAVPILTMQYNNAVREGLAGYRFDQYGMYYYTDIYIQ